MPSEMEVSQTAPSPRAPQIKTLFEPLEPLETLDVTNGATGLLRDDRISKF